jgi:hypothetical protein
MKTLAILEGVGDQRLLWLEAALSHLIALERMRVFHLLTTCLFSHLPLEGGDAAGRATATHEANWGVPDFDFIWNILDRQKQVL